MTRFKFLSLVIWLVFGLGCLETKVIVSSTDFIDKSPDSTGNLYINNTTKETLYLYVGNEDLPVKEISPKADFFLIHVPADEFAKTLKIWKKTDVIDPSKPSENVLFRRWDVVLSKEANEANRTTWVIAEGDDTGTGTLRLNYPDIGLGEIPVIYSVDVFLNNKSGAKVTALGPGTKKQIGIKYGYHILFFLYWFSDPNSVEGRQDIGWIEGNVEGDTINLLLNDANQDRSMEIPIFYHSSLVRLFEVY